MCLASAQRRRAVRDNTGSHCADECELSQAKRPRIQESGDAYEIHHDMKSTRPLRILPQESSPSGTAP